MACCGGSSKRADFSGEFSRPQTFDWERTPRQRVTMVCDTLVEYKARGNRTIVGRATGFTYPRGSYPKQIYIDRRDASAAPHDWRIVPPPPPTPKPSPLSSLAAIIDGSYEPPAPSVPRPVAAQEVPLGNVAQPMVSQPKVKKPRGKKRAISIAQVAVDES